MNPTNPAMPASRLSIKQTAHQAQKTVFISGLFAAVTLITACAGQPPKETMSQAELAVSEASDTKASQFEPLMLRKARDHLDQAKLAQQDKEYKQAQMLAEKAIVEARLAKASAEAQETQNTLAELEKSIQALREESSQMQQ